MQPGREIVDSAILLATLPNLSTPFFLAPVIATAASHTKHRLIIVLFSRHFNVHYPGRKDKDYLTFSENQALSRTESWDPVQRILTFTYVQAAKIAQQMNKVLMDVDVLLRGLNQDFAPALPSLDICFRVSGDSIAVPLPPAIGLLRQLYIPPGDADPLSGAQTAVGTPSVTAHIPPLYPVTALGGTFDHLHSGHKILLSMAAYITSRKLIVGITEDALLQNKSNKHVLEPLSVRTERVRAFLHFFKPEIALDLVPIHDVYGPTGWDPDIQALVVSKETMSGGEAIAAHRKAHSLPALRTFLIDVISATNASLDHEDAEWLKMHKLSSTFIRQWIVDSALQKESADAQTEKDKVVDAENARGKVLEDARGIVDAENAKEQEKSRAESAQESTEEAKNLLAAQN
ncbi:Phosphopantetheine adenylyltransferase [Psilocybe cubensis]|uniref:Cytidyltransferase-like domain-containing protein n=2 Tax=Psilocybe cubensis TaxID=181762 RepID=A0A8H7Y5S4_PSICU|nr:Phosphopantetheine adenylyltransferase [Psilocybe cubensis]KAH9484388.1 Phosphopantetheine adenylyltransferase [Psilocybe cubensis]